MALFLARRVGRSGAVGAVVGVMRVGTGGESGRRAGVDGSRRFGSHYLASAAAVVHRTAVGKWRGGSRARTRPGGWRQEDRDGQDAAITLAVANCRDGDARRTVD